MGRKTADYIGDGVYVEYDGFGIVLTANDFDNPTDKIVLEPIVLSSLISFAKRVGMLKED